MVRTYGVNNAIKKGKSKKAIYENIKKEMGSGKDKDQAIAIAMAKAGKSKKKKEKRNKWQLLQQQI